MSKYSWDFDDNAEIWYNDQYDTIDECISAAQNAVINKDYQTDEAPAEVYIGEIKPFAPYVDATDILDGMSEQAGDECGEIGYEWEPYNYKKQNELDELSHVLTNNVIEWLKKYGYNPSFYSIKNIKEYSIFDERTE